MTEYCPRCNGTNLTLIRESSTAWYYRCEDCTAELGRPLIFPRFKDAIMAQAPAEEKATEVTPPGEETA